MQSHEPTISAEPEAQPVGRLRPPTGGHRAPPSTGGVEDTATGDARAAFDRAYERTKLVVRAKEAGCSHSAAHRTLDPEQFRAIVIDELAWAAKTALGETAHLDPLWMPWRPGPRGPLPLTSDL